MLEIAVRTRRKTLLVLNTVQGLKLVPDSFLDGSAPSLMIFVLYGIPFPGLPKLLLSATHLTYLWLTPGAMVALLSSLESLSLEFESGQSRPEAHNRSLPPPKLSSPLSKNFGSNHISIIQITISSQNRLDSR